MPTQTPYKKPDIFIRCLCGVKEWSVSHCEPGFVSAWHCDKCDGMFSIERLDNGDFSLTERRDRSRKILLTLESTGPVMFQVEGSEIADANGNFDDEATSLDFQKYHYEEGTCPINWMRNIVEVIDPETGDDDPHGLFVVRLVEPWKVD